MNERKLVSVEEYARLKGISKTTVYSMLKGALSDCLVVKNGIKYIDISEPTKEQEDSSTIEQKQEPEKGGEESAKDSTESFSADEYKAEIERLRNELEEERRHSRSKDSKLLEMMDKVIKLTENTQILTARIQEQQILIQQNQRLLEDNANKPKRSIFQWFRRKQNIHLFISR